MIQFEMTEEQAELLLDILAETQFPLMSPQTEFAAQLFCELHEEVYDDEEDFCECCGGPLEDSDDFYLDTSGEIIVNFDSYDIDEIIRKIRGAQH